MRTRLSPTLALIGSAAFLLSACESSGLGAAGAALNPAADVQQWRLVQGSIDNRPLNTALADITLQMNRDGFSGTSGVNRYQTTVERRGGNLHVSEDIRVTRMAGSVEQMRLESDYLSALRRVTEAQQAADSLQLQGEGVDLHFRPAP